MMLHLLRWDVRQLARQQLITVSVLLAAVYIGLFFLLRPLGNLDNVLVLLIYNDPVVTGYLFAGILLLFERNQDTLAALAVSPISFGQYLWSKALALTILAVLMGTIMAVAGHGWQLQYLHLVGGVGLTTLFFAFGGLLVAAFTTSFNVFLVRSLVFFIGTALPLLPFFGLHHGWWYYLIPSYPGLILLRAALSDVAAWQLWYAYGYGLVGVVVSYWLAYRALQKTIRL